MLSKNIPRGTNKKFGRGEKKKIVISAVLVISLFFIGYGIYTFTNLKKEESKKADAKVETGDRPLKQTVTVYVNASGGLSLRQNPDKNSKKLDTIPNKTKLETIEELNGWYKVRFSGKEGWISKQYTTASAPAKEKDQTETWSYFTNSKYGYKIKYPLGWKYQDYGPNAAGKTLSMVAFSAQELPASIPAGTEFLAPITLEVSSKTLDQKNQEYSTISGVVISPAKVGVYSGTKYSFTSVSSNTQETAIVFSAGGKTFVASEGGGYSEDLLKMVNTFTIGT